MKLGKYILDLLLENETVIIPGFGAFISEYKPAEISETEIKPPSRSVAFSPNIRNNDGLLVGYVANAEQVSHFDALKIIEKERDNIVFLLDKSEEVIFEGIGGLISNEKNDLLFTPSNDENQLMESYGLDTVLLEKLTEEQSESDIEEEEPEIKNESIPVGNDQPEESGELIDDAIVESEIVTEATEGNSLEEISTTDSDTKVESEKPEINIMTETVFVTTKIQEPKSDNKRRVSWYWFLLVLVPIIIAGIFVAKNILDKKPASSNSNVTKIQQSPQNDGEMVKQPAVVPDTTKNGRKEEINQDTLAAVPSEQPQEENLVPGQPIYYLVGGSFKDEENARAYMEELKDKGFEPFYMGERGNFFMVGIGKYETDGQAVRARDTIWMKNPGLGLWVMKE